MKRKDKISDEEKALFRAHTKGVRRLPPAPLLTKSHKPLKCPIKNRHDIQEIFSDVLTLPTVQYQEILEFCRAGLSQPFFRQLRRGQFAVADTLNLRLMSVTQAKQALWDFLQYHCKQGSRCLMVIHGKGHRSPTAQPVLKNYVNQWLRQYPQVLAFCSAQPEDGGSGAVYVLLRAKVKAEKNT
ncbi:MAG: Smr/MutS family protein [Gammaproteobacteria bacterium]